MVVVIAVAARATGATPATVTATGIFPVILRAFIIVFRQ
jgi:hypothetical protein